MRSIRPLYGGKVPFLTGVSDRSPWSLNLRLERDGLLMGKGSETSQMQKVGGA